MQLPQLPQLPQLDLLELLTDIDREERRQANPYSLFTSSARGVLARTAEYDAWIATWGAFGAIPNSHAWTVCFTHSDTVTDVCQPTVLSAHLGCLCRHRCECITPVAKRGACTSCTWEGPIEWDDGRVDCRNARRASAEDSAAADALDHAHPGWRNSPVVRPLPATASKTVRARWENTVHDVYGDRPHGWPIITTRAAYATRTVPGRSPWGGYDVAACNVESIR